MLTDGAFFAWLGFGLSCICISAMVGCWRLIRWPLTESVFHVDEGAALIARSIFGRGGLFGVFAEDISGCLAWKSKVEN